MRDPLLLIVLADVLLVIVLAITIIGQPKASTQLKNAYHPYSVEMSVRDM